MTLDELYNKSREGFMLSLCQENTSIGQKSYLELYRVTTLTKNGIMFGEEFIWMFKNSSQNSKRLIYR